jgi:diguanylate cyclase (GGDEF)-like protein/PAS domain S-box-containing protein
MPSDAAVKAEVLSKKLSLISQNAGVGLVATAAASMVLVAAPTTAYSSLFLWFWWFALIIISIIRVVMSRRFLRATLQGEVDPHRWYRHFLILISVLSLLWVVGISYFNWQASQSDRMLAALVAAAMAAGSVSTLSPLITLYRIYAAPMVGTIALFAFALAEQGFDIMFGLISLIYLFGITRSADYLHQTLSLSLYQAITERRQAEELHVAHMVYQAIGEAVVITDTSGHILATNDAFEKMSEIGQEQLVALSLFNLCSDRQSPFMYQRMMQTMASQGSWQGEVFYRRKNGEEYVKWLHLTSISDQKGEPYRYVGMYSNMTDQKRSEESAWREANFDALTLLPNRRLFLDRTTQEIKKVLRSNRSVAVLIVDLDGFNEVNDTLGHHIGDLLLVEAAKRVQSCIRLADTVARTGGDEFSIVLSDLPDAEHIERIAQTVNDRLQEPFKIEGDPIYTSASIGIAIYPDDARSADELLKGADQALFLSKKRGGNRYGFFTSEMQDNAIQRRKMVNDLRNALHRHQLELLYQPIVELADGRITKVEALLRWNHPELGIISPTVFIPVAEESGLIQTIGNWAFRTAATQVKRWEDEDGITLQVSVNRSAVQFHANTDLDDWLGYLQQIGLAGDRVTVEITESMILDSSTTVTTQLARYVDAGLQISIDDFGTGYSSLSYLKKFKAHYIKIDQSFVHDLELDTHDLALVEAIIVMSHKLGFRVIAEGIETEAQRRILSDAGCDFGQGYLFSHPLQADELKRVVLQQRGD